MDGWWDYAVRMTGAVVLPVLCACVSAAAAFVVLSDLQLRLLPSALAVCVQTAALAASSSTCPCPQGAAVVQQDGSPPHD